MTSPETAVKIKPNLNLREPRKFKVIYVNDDVTTMEFVTESLVAIFGYSEMTAIDLAQQIHEAGSAVVAVLPYEIAEQKGVEVTMLARNSGFPLIVKIEPDI